MYAVIESGGKQHRVTEGDLIKVEKIDGGDDTRRFLPPDIRGESAAFMMMNRNKRGIALDLKSDDG
ncbi:MAG: bL21 family ribosomal protein, partial [Myxococcota bacterium]